MKMKKYCLAKKTSNWQIRVYQTLTTENFWDIFASNRFVNKLLRWYANTVLSN